MTELKDLTIEEFAKVTASDAPAPGGGSVAAVAGSWLPPLPRWWLT